MIRQVAVAALAACAGVTPVGASPSVGASGQVDLVLNGEEQTWSTVVPDDEAPDPELHFRDFGFVWQASISAVGPVPVDGMDDDAAVPPSLVITFSGVNGDITATEASIVLLAAPDGRRYVSADDDDGLVIVEMLELTEDTAMTEGSFAALLCFRERVFAAHDPDDCVQITGRFAASLPRDEG